MFGSEGDAHFAAFPSAGAAVRAAVAAQRALAAHPWPAGEVRVRMGLHTGEVQVANGDYHGLEVHRAARVAAVAHGGQVLVSAATRALAPDARRESRSATSASTASRTSSAPSACSSSRRPGWTPTSRRRGARRGPAREPADGAHLASSAGRRSSGRRRCSNGPGS